MLVDARSIPSDELIASDVCIIGGGPAGISIALALKQRAVKIVLLESGGVSPDEEAQRLNQGIATGHRYYGLDTCRVRGLGGSTNMWGGWCRPLDDEDFDERDWMPHSGWPVTKAELAPYYARAQGVCRLGPYDYDARRWPDAAHHSNRASASSTLSDIVFQIGPTRFGREYRADLARASNVTVLMHANATELEMDASHRRVVRVRVATLAGSSFAVASRIFVLAAGGIENPRILLASRRQRGCGIANEHDLVGRFFTEHLHVPVGILRPKSGTASFYGERRTRGVTVRGGMSLCAAVRSQRQLHGCGVTFHNSDDPHDVLSPTRMPAGYESLRLLMKAARHGERPAHVWHHATNVLTSLDTVATLAYRKVVKPHAAALMIGCRTEQVPNPDSRVTLDESRDPFGVPRARLHWTLTARDIGSFREFLTLWPGELAHLGHVEPFFPRGDNGWLERVAAGAHHIGTTRMHRDPRKGVVDEHCRAHGVSNLYVAGSSVFPTAGWTPPTLTIIALALRLADHLATRATV
jgi:choline dehydrogenase-like flavoprotein